jgi:hypothetical protein
VLLRELADLASALVLADLLARPPADPLARFLNKSITDIYIAELSISDSSACV